MTDLGTLGGSYSVAYGINANGQSVGNSWIGTQGNGVACLFANGKVTNLGYLPDSNFSVAYGINSSGTIVGTAFYEYASPSYTRAFVHAHGVMTDIGSLGGTSVRASAINAEGLIVGESELAGNTATHAFVYHDGMFTDLGTLGGSFSSAKDINASGQIVGTSPWTTANNDEHAFLYENGAMIDLGTLGGQAV